ncbi:MAG TPA: sugar ABC transporter substrate-binding protein [Chloroflexi bacterium]|nr:sugar ABC transporter substrate-binding protein [Chloroflexota bacterium]
MTLWFHSGRGSERDALSQILDNFAAERSDIVVDAVELPEGDYNQQVQAAAVAGDLPCVLDFDGPFLYNYAWGGFLTPIGDYVSDEMQADFLPSIINQGTYNGQLYSLGQFDSGLALWARKSYLEAAGVRIPTIDDPWTREEFEEALAALQELPEVEYALDMKMNYGRGEWFTYGFSPILQSFGADLIDRETYETAEGVLNGPEAVAAMEMVQGWFEAGYVNAEPAGDTDFVDGKSAISWVGHWVAPDYMDALGDDLLLLPMPDFGEGPKTGMGSWNWGITSQCPNPDAAWEVLEFILQPEQILIMTNANGAVPARFSAIEQSELYAEGGMLNLYVQQIERGFAVPRPITPAYPTITTAFAEAFDNIVHGADVQEELDKAVDKIDQDLMENDYYR